MIMLEADRCLAWLREVFGPEAEKDVEERALRFLEEAIELAQSMGVRYDQAQGLADQVFSKPVGEPEQELGGTMVTLATLCAVTGLNAGVAYRQEFSRCDSPAVKAKIRGKRLNPNVVRSSAARVTPTPSDDMEGFAPIASIDR